MSLASPTPWGSGSPCYPGPGHARFSLRCMCRGRLCHTLQVNLGREASPAGAPPPHV